MSDVLTRLARVRAQVDGACEAAGRDPSEVQLVAVSKRHPATAISAALEGGQLDFGENYAQELRDKADELSASPIRWHYIGRLQSNKAKYIAPHAFRVHALEEVRHAEALVQRSEGRGVDALVAVNVGGEEQKGGLLPGELLERVRVLSRLEGLRLRGLMTLPPVREDPEDVAPFFAEVADLLARCQDDGHPMRELSMGMSHDFPVAIRHGATWVRVGTAIFGPRPG